jgi:hypothetical protein
VRSAISFAEPVPARLGDQNGADADEGDARDAPAVEIFAKHKIGKHSDCHIGQAEERIGKRQLDF